MKGMTPPGAVLLIMLVGSLLPVWASDAEQLKTEALAEADQWSGLVDEMAKSLWEFSETALKEHQSARVLTEKLEEAGFSVERNVAGMPTAFVAQYGSGSPVIGILAEYDALPGVGNQAVPGRKSRTDGVTSGHGCGHNLFGAASVGGAIALKKIMAEKGLKGTLKLFGSPAEETLVGKVYMAKAGVFDDLDAVIEWHPGTSTEVRNQTGRAMNSFEVEFFGQAAHGSADPWNGRSALDAVELMNDGVNLMREHVRPTTRIHYVITDGGDAPNVVPEYAKVWYYVRDVNREEVGKYYERILKIAEGAALATGTEHQVSLITGVHEYLLNRPLQEALQENLEMVGAPDFDSTDQAFARDLQQSLDLETSGYSSAIEPLEAEPEAIKGGSTDVAEVSYLAPTAGFSVATAAQAVPWHSWATTACHGTPAGRKGARVAARVILATGIDLLTNSSLIEAAKEYHEEALGGRTYTPPIPQDQQPPLPQEDQ